MPSKVYLLCAPAAARNRNREVIKRSWSDDQRPRNHSLAGIRREVDCHSLRRDDQKVLQG